MNDEQLSNILQYLKGDNPDTAKQVIQHELDKSRREGALAGANAMQAACQQGVYGERISFGLTENWQSEHHNYAIAKACTAIINIDPDSVARKAIDMGNVDNDKIR